MNVIANRPTPEQMASLFQKHGIKPIRSRYIVEGRPDHPTCGCLVGALLVEATGSIVSARRYLRYGSDRRPIQHLLNLPYGYVSGLDHGFSREADELSETPDPEYDAGLRDGIAVRQIVLPAKP
jgi:hypothetical protein